MGLVLKGLPLNASDCQHLGNDGEELKRGDHVNANPASCLILDQGGTELDRGTFWGEATGMFPDSGYARTVHYTRNTV